MIKQIAVIAILASVVSLAAVACGGGDDESAAPPPAAAAPAPEAAAPTATPAIAVTSPGKIEFPDRVRGVTGQTDGVTQFTLNIQETVEAYGYHTGVYFDPGEMTFKVGETVNFTVIPNPESRQRHSVTVRDLGIDVEAKYGKQVTFTHTFDKPGRFKLVDKHFPEFARGWINVVE